ncbi:hypothetical protein BDZ90DRAFT_35256 [Jaminaea rosea]|uniref:Uncharacterized protein n=1 Tax=Jaminaea rosea TaxID=1569628 RepID=A0A316V0P2_9BASI|nr:hypothetical protein BDZ90DRAFT_35256 [Jaminaea rosea]PWN31116.1 hypothetical protein BDZ90DRAFT_35256 [Jaminaea rosea]
MLLPPSPPKPARRGRSQHHRSSREKLSSRRSRTLGVSAKWTTISLAAGTAHGIPTMTTTTSSTTKQETRHRTARHTREGRANRSRGTAASPTGSVQKRLSWHWRGP